MNEGNENTQVQESVQAEKPSSKKDVKLELKFSVDFKSKSFIRSGVLFLISLLLLISVFCPIITYKSVNTYSNYQLDTDEEYTISIGASAVDSIVFFFDRIKEESREEIEESKLLEKYTKAANAMYVEKENIDHKDGSLTGKYVRLFEDAARIYYRLALRYETENLPVDAYFIPVFALTLIFSAVALFLVASMNLYCELTEKERVGTAKILSKGFFSKAVWPLLAVIIASIIALYTLLFSAMGINDVYGANLGAMYTYGISVTAVIALVLAIGAFVANIVERIRTKELVVDKNVRKRMVSAVLALILIFTMFMPIATAKMDSDNAITGKSARVPIRLDFVNGMRLDKAGYSMTNLDPIGYSFNEATKELYIVDGMVALGYIMIAMSHIITAFALTIFISNLMQLSCGIIPGKRHLGMRVTNLVLSVLLGILYVSMGSALVESTSKAVTFSVGIIGGVMLTLTILCLVFLPKDKKPKEKNSNAEVNE